MHSAPELQIYFSHMVDNLFQTNLCSIDRNSSPVEYQCLVNLLSPKGPVFQLAEKLSTEVATPRILFAINRLPPGLVEFLVHSNASHFIHQKTSLDNQYLQLNPVEYFLFLLIGHVLEKKVADLKMDINNWPIDVYFSLFDLYLSHFLNVDDQCSLNHSVLDNSGNRYHPCGRPVGQGHHCLLRRDAPRTNLTFNHASILSSNNKAATLMNIVSELWFSYVHTGENQQLQRAIRTLFKKLHSVKYFETNSHLQLRRRLYKSLKTSLSTWPLDSSYRLPLEVWLTFVQPWRYVANDAMNEFGDQVRNRYLSFIDEHLLFYTQLMLHTLDRIAVLDLTLPTNVILISRISKVGTKKIFRAVASPRIQYGRGSE